jgi:hypothetical protein
MNRQKIFKLQIIGKKFESLKTKYLICQQKIIDEALELFDLVDQIQKFFIEQEKKICQVKNLIQNPMKTID